MTQSTVLALYGCIDTVRASAAAAEDEKNMKKFHRWALDYICGAAGPTWIYTERLNGMDGKKRLFALGVFFIGAIANARRPHNI